jgi:hypothetical protein
LEPDTDNLGSSFNSTISLVTSFPSRGLEKCLANLLSTEVLDIQSLLSTTTDTTLDASFLSLRRPAAAAAVLRGDFTEDDLRLEVVLQSPNIWEPPILASTEEQRGNSTDDEQHTSSLLSTDICNR